jgi:hypothetical protein
MTAIATEMIFASYSLPPQYVSATKGHPQVEPNVSLSMVLSIPKGIRCLVTV